jgi:hypothetical protein
MLSMAWRSALVLAGVFVFAGDAAAATPGFEEDFTIDAGGFSSGQSTVTRVTSGGVGGAGDPFLEVSTPTSLFLGAFSQAPDLNGNLPADGVTGYSFWLRDTGADDTLEIHVGVGIPFVNYWQSLQGFAPPDGTWQQFTVDLTAPAQWVQIIGSGTFADALAGSTNLLFRHDHAPYTQFPDPVAAGFGLDRMQVLPVPVELPAVSGSGRGVLALLLVTIAAFAARGFRAGARSVA